MSSAGTITGLTGDKSCPYEITCTKAKDRGYIGTIVSATAKSVYKRTTAKRCEPTKEEEELLNCEVSTDFGDMGIHKGYIADVGYDSGEDETQIDIIYEDQDIRTVRAIEALQQRELHPKGRECDYGETFSLNKIRLRPKKQGNWKKRTRHHNNTIVSPTGDAVQAAKTEIRNRASTGRRTRASVAENKTARTRDIEERRTAHEGDQGTAFTEPSVFADRALSTGKRRPSERVAPGLGPGPAGGIRES